MIEWLCINVYPYPFMLSTQLADIFTTSSTNLPVLMKQLNVIKMGISSDVSVPYDCLVLKKVFDYDIHTLTPFVSIKFQWAEFRIRTNPPSRSGCFHISKLCVFSTFPISFKILASEHGFDNF